MRRTFLLSAICLIVCSATAAAVTAARAPRPEGPASARTAAAETLWFGGTHWNAAASRWEANANGLWTFDSGIDNNWEGWTVRDLSLLPPPTVPPGNPDNSDFRWTHQSLYAQYGTPFRILFPAATPPDTGAIWCSKYEFEADQLCYPDGQGYGNNWEHEAKKTFTYSGAGDVRLGFKYFMNTEKSFDFAYLYLEFNGTREAAPRLTMTGIFGSPTGKLTKNLTVTAASIPAGTNAVTAVFHFSSDSGLSDEDGGINTLYGPFCCYNFLYQDVGTPANDDEDTFETGPEGWTFVQKPAAGGWADLTPVAELPPPAVSCSNLQGNVLTFYDKTAGPGDPLHPLGQDMLAMAPVIDLGAAGFDGYGTTFADLYMDLPLSNDVYFLGWYAADYLDGCHGGTSGTWMIWPSEPRCYEDAGIQGDVIGVGVMHQLYVGLEVVNACSPWTGCTNAGGNTTPWFDNIRVGVFPSPFTVGAPVPPALPELTARPNPFRPSVSLEYTVPAAGLVTLRIYDVAGALVRTIVDETKSAGRYTAPWNGADDAGRAMSSGVYWAKCRAGEKEVSKRLVLLK